MKIVSLMAIGTALPLIACSQMQSMFDPQSQSQTPSQHRQYGNWRYGSPNSQQNTAYNQDQIRQVQQALNSKGFYPGPTDGRLGPETKSALDQFQRTQGLQQTGRPDKQTLIALGVGQSNGIQNWK